MRFLNSKDKKIALSDYPIVSSTYCSLDNCQSVNFATMLWPTNPTGEIVPAGGEILSLISFLYFFFLCNAIFLSMLF